MADQNSNPLLDLLKEKGLIDDLQFEEVLAEHTRTGKPVMQIIPDFGIMDLDSVLHEVADNQGTEVVTLKDHEFSQDLLRLVPGNTARMYQCVPVELNGNALKVAFMDPMSPQRADDLGFVIRKDVQLVVADPVQIEKAIERYYGTDSESVSDILKELGSDAGIAEEAAAA